MRNSLATLLVVFALAAPASASLQIDPIPGAVTAIDSGNNFMGNLATLGLTHITKGNILVTVPGTLTFFAHASESGYINTFSVGITDVLTFTENPDILTWNAAGTQITNVGATVNSITTAAATSLFDLLAKFTSNIGVTATPGSVEFGIFVDSTGNYNPLGTTPTTMYFGYDDNGASPDDDNHDDLIVSVRFSPSGTTGGNPPGTVPEPLSGIVWGLLAAAAVVLPGIARRR